MTYLTALTVKIDTNRDGGFTGADLDVSASVTGFKLVKGFTGLFKAVAAPSTLEVLLDNLTGIYAPEHGSATIEPGMLIQVTVTTSAAVTHTLCTVRLDAVVVRQNVAVLSGSGFIGRPTRILAPLMEDVRTDEVVEALIQLSRLYDRLAIAGTGNYCVIGVNGRSELGSVYLWPETTLTLSADSGATTFDVWGGSAGEGELWTMLEEVVFSEFGKLWEDAAGIFQMMSRTVAFQALTADYNWTGESVTVLDYRYQTLFTQVAITTTPRTTGQITWSQAEDIDIAPGDTIVQRVRLRADDGRIVGVQTVEMIAGAPAGVPVSAVGYQNGLELTIANLTPLPVVVSGLTVTVEALIQLDDFEARSPSSFAMLTDGVTEYTRRLPDLPAVTAQELASGLAAMYGVPRGYVRSVRVDDIPAAVGIEPCQVVAFDGLGDTEHGGFYRVQRVSHTYGDGDYKLVVELMPYSLARAEGSQTFDSDFFIIGLHAPDGSHNLAF